MFAPATVANLGPGFDVLGLALSQPGDELEAEVSDRPGVEIVEGTGEGGRRPGVQKGLYMFKIPKMVKSSKFFQKIVKKGSV